MQIEPITQSPEYKQALQRLMDESARLALLRATRELLIYDAPLWCVALLETMAKRYPPCKSDPR